jgi:hypothetical protein
MMKNIAYLFLLILILLSLALNAVVIAGLLNARDAAVEAIDQGLQALSGLENETFETVIRVQETIPVSETVPFRRELVVPIDLTVPIHDQIAIQETFEVPISTPFRDFTIDIPVSATVPVEIEVPVDVQVPIAISETIPISTEVSIDLTVPVVIEVADTALPEYLEQMRALLTEVKEALAFEKGLLR